MKKEQKPDYGSGRLFISHTAIRTSAILIAGFFGSLTTLAQDGIGVGIADVDPSAVLHVQPDGAPKGMLIPRFSISERDNITTPADGLIIYNTDDSTFNYYAASTWVTLIPTPAHLNIDMSNYKITNLAAGDLDSDAVNKGQMDTQLSTKVAKSGDSMSGALNMGNNNVTNLANGTASGDAVNIGQLATTGAANNGAKRIGTRSFTNFTGSTVDAVLLDINNSVARKEYTAVHNVGNIGATNYEVGTVTHNQNLANYMVLYSLETGTLDNAWQSTNCFVIIYNKTPNAFSYMIREWASTTQVITIRLMVVPF